MSFGPQSCISMMVDCWSSGHTRNKLRHFSSPCSNFDPTFYPGIQLDKSIYSIFFLNSIVHIFLSYLFRACGLPVSLSLFKCQQGAKTSTNMWTSPVYTKVTSNHFNCLYSIPSAPARFPPGGFLSVPQRGLPSLIAVVLIPKSGIFQVKFGVVTPGSDINLSGNVVAVVMKDARCYLYPCVSSVLSKVGEFCLPGRFVFSPGSRGPVTDSSCST